MLKNTGKNLVKHQIKEFLEDKSIESRSWKIVKKISQPLFGEDQKKKG